ncbi:Beta-ketoacyl synthase [Beggiatoa sp. SS]|nr:Beta-ketoacyl synthase [Beggiatoa sp. SS]
MSETHGTGTSLGDPIEGLALANVLGQERTTPLMIGSVKTNLGHLSSAAGIASLIKVVLSHQHAEIPPNLHFNEPNPHIPWDKLPLRVPTEPTPWTGEPRLAGVSSFGMTGTNAHVLLEAFEEKPTSVMSEAASRTLHILPLSAKTVEALQTLVTHYVEWLDKHHDAALTDICFTAAIGRNHFVHRTAIVADSRESLTENLTKLVQGQTTQAVFVGHNKQAPKLAMLFTGQGSQYTGMAQNLYKIQPVFRQMLDRCATLLEPLLDIPLTTLLFDPAYTDKLNHTRYTQPVLFAIEVALYELWKSIGIEPDMVIGHSVGEYAAAYAAGIMELETGLKLIAKRGELMGALPAGGAMVAIFVELESLQQVLINYTSLTFAG